MKDLPAGTVVQHWEGKIVQGFKNVPEKMQCYAILLDDDKWMVPTSDAQYANHSCSPNCEVNDNLDIITIKPVKKGEELCFDYCITYEGEEPGEWNSTWTFACKCGSKKCRGLIDKYVMENGTAYEKKK